MSTTQSDVNWKAVAAAEQKARVDAEADLERITHGICDALQFLPSPRKSAGTAILRGLLKGSPHEGHDAGNWS